MFTVKAFDHDGLQQTFLAQYYEVKSDEKQDWDWHFIAHEKMDDGGTHFYVGPCSPDVKMLIVENASGKTTDVFRCHT